MSGEVGANYEQSPIRDINRDEHIYKFDDFTVHKARFWVEDLKEVVDGYAVIWTVDDVVQGYLANIQMAVSLAYNSALVIQQAKAYEEMQAKADDTTALLGLEDLSGDDGDVLN
jgi:hypothetical protein